MISAIVLACCAVAADESAEDLMARVVAHRESIAEISVKLDRVTGADDWPEKSRARSTLSQWSDFRSNRHRVDLNVSGYREVYGCNCEFPGTFFEFLETSSNGVFTAKFDSGTVAPRFIMDLRCFGIVCLQLSQQTGSSEWKDLVSHDFSQADVSAVTAELQAVVSERGVSCDMSDRYRVVTFDRASNSRQKFVIDLESGPSVIFSEVVAVLEQPGMEGVVVTDRMWSKVRQVGGRFWFPESVMYEMRNDQSIMDAETVTVTACTVDDTDQSVFTLAGIGLPERTLVSRPDQPWTQWINGQLVPEVPVVTDWNPPRDRSSRSWLAFLALNGLGLIGVIVLVLMFRRRGIQA